CSSDLTARRGRDRPRPAGHGVLGAPRAAGLPGPELLALAVRPGEQLLQRQSGDDPFARDAGRLGAGAAVGEELQLTRGVGVGVDGEEAAEVTGVLEQPGGRVTALGPGVDLHGDVVL